MPKLRLAGALLVALALLALPALADAKVKQGYYIDAKTQTYLQTNARLTKLKLFQASCMRGAMDGGQFSVQNKVKLKQNGKFSYTGKVGSVGTGFFTITVKGKATSSTAKGTITFAAGSCDTVTFKAKYEGLNPAG